MSNTIQSNKTHVRADYIQCKQLCRICEILKPKGSKIFNSNYALKYHLTTEHNREDEISAGITRKQILQTVRAISQALEWKMLVDLSRVDTKLMSEGQEML